jgi:hypothetical protein
MPTSNAYFLGKDEVFIAAQVFQAALPKRAQQFLYAALIRKAPHFGINFSPK